MRRRTSLQSLLLLSSDGRGRIVRRSSGCGLKQLCVELERPEAGGRRRGEMLELRDAGPPAQVGTTAASSVGPVAKRPESRAPATLISIANVPYFIVRDPHVPGANKYKDGWLKSLEELSWPSPASQTALEHDVLAFFSSTLDGRPDNPARDRRVSGKIAPACLSEWPRSPKTNSMPMPPSINRRLGLSCGIREKRMYVHLQVQSY